MTVRCRASAPDEPPEPRVPPVELEVARPPAADDQRRPVSDGRPRDGRPVVLRVADDLVLGLHRPESHGAEPRDASDYTTRPARRSSRCSSSKRRAPSSSGSPRSPRRIGTYSPGSSSSSCPPSGASTARRQSRLELLRQPGVSVRHRDAGEHGERRGIDGPGLEQHAVVAALAAEGDGRARASLGGLAGVHCCGGGDRGHGPLLGGRAVRSDGSTLRFHARRHLPDIARSGHSGVARSGHSMPRAKVIHRLPAYGRMDVEPAPEPSIPAATSPRPRRRHDRARRGRCRDRMDRGASGW